MLKKPFFSRTLFSWGGGIVGKWGYDGGICLQSADSAYVLDIRCKCPSLEYLRKCEIKNESFDSSPCDRRLFSSCGETFRFYVFSFADPFLSRLSSVTLCECLVIPSGHRGVLSARCGTSESISFSIPVDSTKDSGIQEPVDVYSSLRSVVATVDPVMSHLSSQRSSAYRLFVSYTPMLVEERLVSVLVRCT